MAITNGRSVRPTVGATPGTFSSPGHAPFSFAGLWAHNDKLSVTSCTIITEPSASPITDLHDRQPIILDPAYYDAWLDPNTPVGDLKGILSHDIDDRLEFYRVDRAVNASSRDKKPNDHPALIEPISLETASEFGPLV